MFEAAIFDMDGVLIDSEPLHLKLEEEFYKILGVDVSLEEHLTYVGTTSHFMWSNIINKYKLPYTVEELVEKDRKRYLDYITDNKEDGIIPIEGVKDLIEDLYKRGTKLAVASSSPFNVIEIVVEKLGLSKYFDELVTGDFVEKSKPEPDIFLYAANKLKKDPKNCAVIEDSHNGVLAAKKAGMKVIGFQNPNSGNQDLKVADIIVNSFHELNYDKIKALF